MGFSLTPPGIVRYPRGMEHTTATLTHDDEGTTVTVHKDNVLVDHFYVHADSETDPRSCLALRWGCTIIAERHV